MANSSALKANSPDHNSMAPPKKRTFFSSENKILLLVIFTISFALLIVAFAINARYQSTLEENYNRFGELMARVIAASAADRIAPDETPAQAEYKVKPFIDTMMSVSNDIAAIEFYDARARLLYAQKRPEISEESKVTDFSAPLRRSRDISPKAFLGEVHVKLTGKTMQDISSATKSIILWMFMSAWLISILAVSLNTYFLSKHLRTLVRGVKRLSTGDFGYKISENDLWGELKNLAESFNDMSVRLRLYEDQNLETITFERNKMEAILLSIADGVVVFDLNGDITILNSGACRMLGVKDSSLLLGTNIVDYITTEGEHCFEPLLREYEQLGLEYHHQLPEPYSKTVEMPGITLRAFVSLIQDAEGESLGYVMVLHDVTKESEVDRLKTSFISNVSHELRTPVTTIKSYVDTIYNHGDDLDEETYKEFIETINVETDRLKKLVNDILDFSRLEEGQYKLELEQQDITPVINLTVQSVKVLAQQKNISLSTAVETSLPSVFINSDSIERVLRNLLSNAIKYTPDGGRIKVRAEVSATGDFLIVSVQDSGIGIPEEHLPFIFDRFYRVENKVHTVKGTGLGLHLVKVAIEDHHYGTVFVTSTVDEGSTFGFKLPLTDPRVNTEKKASSDS